MATTAETSFSFTTNTIAFAGQHDRNAIFVLLTERDRETREIREQHSPVLSRSEALSLIKALQDALAE